MASPYEQTLVEIETAITAINAAIYDLDEWKNGMRRMTSALPGGVTLSYDEQDLNDALANAIDTLNDAVDLVPTEV